MTIFKKRIARSLVTVIFLTLFNVFAAPVVAPKLLSPQAEATTSGIVTTSLQLDVNASNTSDMAGTSGSYPSPTASGGGYYELNGTSHYIVPNTGSAVGAANEVSIFMWVYPKGAGQLLSQLNTTTINYSYHSTIMDFTAGDQLYVGLWNGTDQTSLNLSSTIATPKNNWYLVGLVYTGTKIKGYVNGVYAGETAAFTYVPPATSYFGIGAYDITTIAVGASYGNIRFGSLSVYNTPLSADDISSNFKATVSRFGPTVSSTTDVSTLVNRSATFSTSTCSNTTSGSATCNYQWQLSTDGGTNWNFISNATSNSYTTPILSSSFNGYKYRLYVWDPGTGSTTANDLFTISTVATLSVATPPGSDTDTALALNGSDRYAQVSDASNSPLDLTGNVTMMAWVNPANSCTTDQGVISKDNSYLMYCGAGVWAHSFSSNGQGWSGSGLTSIKVRPNEWHHIAYVHTSSSTSMKVYYDGAFVETVVTGASIMTANNSSLTIGRYSGSYNFNGQIDEVKIFSSARSADQILTDMNTYGPISDTDLAAYYDMNEGTGSTLYNRKVGATSITDLSIVGSQTWPDVKVVDPVSLSVYTTVKFPRSYVTSSGGWRVPSGVTKASIIVTGGGGGAGAGTAQNAGPAGAGGGGGVTYVPVGTLTPGTPLTVTVGQGGRGDTETSIADDASTRNGKGSVFGSYSALGGGGGGSSLSQARGAGSGAGDTSIATGGGSSGYDFGANGGNSCYTQAAAGGVVASGLNGGSGVWGWGGSGGGARGAAANGSCDFQPGRPGIGFEDPITKIIYGFGGYAEGAIANSNGTLYPVNNGWGGSTAYNNPGTTTGDGFSGAAGVVIVRWITALKPSYTKPTNAYLNIGMTETFTTNVAQDSATAVLTRTFKWESTTPAANGAYTLIKQGTGAANAAFSWIPTDTTTSGSGYLYRLTVTDSDTAGLFITDSSTAYAVINRALVVSGLNNVGKKISLAKSETYTITLGTPTYRASMSPTIPGITLDTSTAESAVIKISETMTVGTYYETLTVTDSVSASVVLPLVIKVQAPPQLSNTGEIVADGQVFNLDFSNSASYSPVGQTFADISGAKKTITAPNGGTYSNDFSGIYTLSSTSSQYLTATAFSMLPKWTIETYIRINDTPTAQFCPFASEYASSSISMLLCVDVARTVFTGFFDIVGTSHKWSFKRSEEKIPLNTWVHIVGTFDGIDANLYFDSISTTPNSADGGRYDAGKVPPTPNTNRVFIGKDYPTAVGTTPNISLGFVRAYSTGFTQLQVQQNFNATKARFEFSNQTQIKPTKKYGTLVLDSFTVTSGFETKTVTLAVGDRAGIDWDTATATNQVRLSIQESLTVGTYNDTLTVTDSLGQSSYLPITFTVTKADTITVTMGTAHTTVYTGTAPAGAPRASISGLVGVDTATVETQYSGTYIDSSLRCAEGGSCSVGDVGPGGGWIFYVSSTPINAATGVSNGGIYLEAAPRNWNGDGSGEAGSSFASVLTNVNGTSSAIGTGAENSRILRQELGDSATAATKALNRSFNGVDDWFVPSYDELTRMITVLKPLGLGSFDNPVNLWSSTQNTNPNKANNAWSSNPPVLNELLKTDNYYLRPIRAFSPTYYSTVTPSEVDTYTAKGTNLTFQVGAASNYQAVIYETSTLKITQANQKQLALNLYGAVAGTPFTLQISGGSGTGAVTETITAGSTAVNCRVSNKVLSNDTPSTEQKTCNISITKASSRNYKAETLTATVYFMMFVNNQPTNQVGGGTVIALNGVTSFETSTITPPGITGFSSLNISLSAGGTLRISGSGLTGSITVKFSRNKTVSATAADGTYIDIPIASIQSAGATSGRVAVITVNGEAVSDQSLTITP